MTRDEALKLLRGGKEGVGEWNRRRKVGDELLSLDRANLSRADLSYANLSQANLSGAVLHQANLNCADLIVANLSGADLGDAILCGADLCGADLPHAHLCDANLKGARLDAVDLSDADLRGVDLSTAMLNNCNLAETGMGHTHWGWTTLADVDLSTVCGLDSTTFSGPCSVGVDTLVRSEGRIPESFLRGCGFLPWQVIQAKTYAPSLTRDQFTDLQYKVNIARNQGPLFIGGVFISYSHDDSRFVDKIHGRMDGEGVPVWLDRHDMVVGDLQKQVSRAIRLNDVVLLVLSESSVKSDWVEHELEMARKKEKGEGRDVLCPVALDDAWKAKMGDVLWRQVKKKNLLDFSQWETEAFEPEYRKLVRGLEFNYGAATSVPASGAT